MNDIAKAVNARPVRPVHARRGTAIKVNAIHPDAVQTDMNNNVGTQLEAPEGTRGSMRLALLDADSPNADVFHFDRMRP